MGKIVHISLQDETHKKLKMKAAEEGLTIAQLIAKMIDFYCLKN